MLHYALATRPRLLVPKLIQRGLQSTIGVTILLKYLPLPSLFRIPRPFLVPSGPTSCGLFLPCGAIAFGVLPLAFLIPILFTT